MRQRTPLPLADDRMSGNEGPRENRRESGQTRQGRRRVAPSAPRQLRMHLRALPACGRRPRRDPG
eukprot:2621483-Pleurochrysis_carterae.AAC.1